MNIKFSVYSDENQRIDKFLSSSLKCSRKEILYLFQNKKIKVNEKLINKSYNIKKSDVINIEAIESGSQKFNYDKLQVIYENKNLLLIYKPPFFHSAQIRKNLYSVENFLNGVDKNYILLNRLDYQTEGILIAAKNREFSQSYRELEKNFKIKKYYIAALDGMLKEKLIITNKLDTKNKKKVKVSNYVDNVYKTEVIPIAIYTGFSIANILINRGARHQIRAHCSSAGYPLLGDILYGSNAERMKNYFLFCYGYEIKDINFKYFAYDLLKTSLRKFSSEVLEC